jgi:glycosyltransferase involved in cell wall biosynthesis
MSDSRFHLAIIGTRGVPPRYGGFETFAGELGRRLVERGHRVTVYCRRVLYRDVDGPWEGIERIELPAVRHKYLETVTHAALAAVDASGRGFDVALVCNAANAFVLPLLRSARLPVAINVDGIERKRKKWNLLGRLVYLAGESWSARFATRLVADAEVIGRYYRSRFTVEPEIIPYGSELPPGSSDVLERLGLESRKFLLYVSRFEPENHPLEVVLAYRGLDTEVPLVMVGDAPYSTTLIRELEAHRSERVLLPGALYGADYATLQRNALLYIQATEVGGTHPALIEAMASGGAVVANDTPENREVGAGVVEYFRLGERETLSLKLEELLSDRERIEGMREGARERAEGVYHWERVTDQYETMFRSMMET